MSGGERPSRPAPAAEPAFTAAVVRDAAEFSALEAEWGKLYQRSPRATPFQSHGWLDAWWRAYGRRGRLRVVTVRARTGDLAAAAPLHLRRRGPVRVLAPLGGAGSDFTDVLLAEDALAPDEASAALAVLAGCLRGLPGWDVLDLPEVRNGAAVHRLAGGWPGPRGWTESSPCMELDVCGPDGLLGRLSGKRAAEARRRLRRADALGLVVAEVPAEEVAEGIAELIRLHGERWRERGVNPEHLRPRFARHLTDAAERMVRDGQAAVTRIRQDGELVAVLLDLIGHDMVCGYLLGATPRLYRAIDVTAYVLRHEVQRTAALGRSTFSMLRGREHYKDRWHPTVLVNSRLVLGRWRSPSVYLFTAAVRARARTAAALRDRTWARAVRGWFR